MSVAPSSQPSLPKLPPHEPPQFPLRADAALSANRLRKHDGLRYLRDGLDRSADLLTECADAVNNLVAEREHAARRAGEGEGEGEEDGEAEEWRGRVDELTGRMERAVRRAIDARHEAVGCEEVLRDVTERVGRNSNQLPTAEQLLASQAVAGTQRPGRWRAEDEEDDGDDDEDHYEERCDDEDVSMTGVTAPERPAEFAPSLFWDEQLATRKDRYEAQPLRTRYSEHNRYVAFKSAVWVARHPDGESVPHASTWFRAQEAGSPAPGHRADRERRGG